MRVVFACIAVFGALAERVFGPGRWLLLWRARSRYPAARVSGRPGAQMAAGIDDMAARRRDHRAKDSTAN